MGLLRKHIILAGAASLAVVSFLSSSSASAIDSFSLSDVFGDYRNRTAQLQSHLTNPFGNNCESANPDSTISCNESSFPNLLFNGAPNNTTWGHDGKGVIFVNNDNLINGDPQLATAKSGDTLYYSMEIKTQRYNDEEMTDPVGRYGIYAVFSEGLSVNQDSITIKVDGQTLDSNAYQLEAVNFDETDDGEQMSAAFGGAKSVFYVLLNWSDGNGSFSYGENATITLAYSATIAEKAPSEVFSRGAYVSSFNSMDYSIFRSTQYQATALLRGGIEINRVDINNQPLAGAEYEITGVKADEIRDGVYKYSDTGKTSTFKTGADGRILITEVPFGDYTVKELASPNGNPATETVITKDISQEIAQTNDGTLSYMWNITGMSFLVNDYLIDTPSNQRKLIRESDLSKITGEDNGETSHTLTYNEQTGVYSSASGSGIKVRKGSDAFYLESGTLGVPLNEPKEFVWDDTLKQNIAVVAIEDINQSATLDQFGSVTINGDTATFHYSNSEYSLTYDPKNDAYSGSMNGETALNLRKNGRGYDLEFSPYMFYLHLEYDEEAERYLPSYTLEALSVEAVSDTEVVVSRYFVADYYPNVGRYYTAGMNGYFQMPIDIIEGTAYATKFVFSEREAPDTISNPQTADAIFRALLALAVAIIFGAVLAKHTGRGRLA